jgi:FMN phosphatase YigB (HAD superfamily)
VIKAVLFDLDGTLLKVDMDDFLRHYLHRLSVHFSHLIDPQQFLSDLLSSTQAMIVNDDPALTNRDVFMTDFFKRLPHPPEQILPLIDTFYKEVFPQLQKHVSSFPEIPSVIDTATALGFKLAVATNPLFPRAAIFHRIRWAGLDPDLFQLVTTYEIMHFCKPNPRYFCEITDYLGLAPAECLMVGNDVDDDINAAAGAGLKTLLVEDMLVNRSGSAPLADYRIQVAELGDFLVKLKNGMVQGG